jgi:hypothetical protein
LALVAPAAVLAARTETGGHRIVLYADDALTELAVRDTLHGHQLLGPYSRFGWHHPGPASFELLAVFYRILGFDGRSGYLGGLVIATLAGAAACWLVWRRAGDVAGLFAVAATTVFLYQVGPQVWRTSWNPYLIVLPCLLLAVLCADAATGHLLAAGAAWLVGSAIVQTHIGTAPVVAVWVVGATVAAFVVGRRRPTVPGVALLGGGLVLLWLPPAIDQIRHHPGNATLIWRFFTATHAGHPVGESLNALGTAAATVFTGDRLAGHPSYRLNHGGLLAAGLTVVSLALTGVLAVAARRGRPGAPFALALAAVASTGFVAGTLGNTRVVGPILGFFELWFAVLPVVLGLALAALCRPSARVLPLALVVVLVAGAALGVRAADAPSGPSLSAANVAAVTRLVVPSLRQDGRPVFLDIASHDTWPVAAGVAAELERRGYAVHVSPAWTLLFGARRAVNGREAQRVIIDSPTATPPGELGAAGGVSVGLVGAGGAGRPVGSTK